MNRSEIRIGGAVDGGRGLVAATRSGASVGAGTRAIQLAPNRADSDLLTSADWTRAGDTSVTVQQHALRIEVGFGASTCFAFVGQQHAERT